MPSLTAAGALSSLGSAVAVLALPGLVEGVGYAGTVLISSAPLVLLAPVAALTLWLSARPDLGPDLGPDLRSGSTAG